MNKAKKVLYTMIAGAAAGMVVGILFAPEKGSETRKKLRWIKSKLTGDDNDLGNNRKALEELSDVLGTELSIVNERLAELS